MVVLGQSSCGLAESARIARYLADQSSGQCGPCVHGLPAIADDLARLARGQGDGDSLARLHRRLREVNGRGACRHPDGAVSLVRSALAVFATDIAAHGRGEPCRVLAPSSPRSTFRGRSVREMSALRITVDPVACAAYGYCAEILPEAISVDGWGYPIIGDRPLPAELVTVAKRAARDCPKRAITLRERRSV